MNAASLHHNKQQTRSVQSAASVGLKKGVEPVEVKTSLKLTPKRPPVVATGQVLKSVAEDFRAETQVKAIQQAASRTLAQKPAGRKMPAQGMIPRSGQGRVLQDVVRRGASRPVAGVKTSAGASAGLAGAGAAKKPAKAAMAPRSESHIPMPTGHKTMDIRKPQTAKPRSAVADAALVAENAKKAPKTRPLDSIKNRFRPAPKGYAGAEPEDVNKNRPYQVEDFLNPSHPVRTVEGEKDGGAVHLYGMMDGPEKVPDPVNMIKTEVADDELGVVEDYRPYDGGVHMPSLQEMEEEKAEKAPDANRYVLGAKSPFFLNSVSVEKRPLSGGEMKAAEMETPVYAAQELTEVEAKNQYEKAVPQGLATAKPEEKPVDKEEEPTVIIPTQKRSHAPLFVLLLITVILGATVGALAYLCFFQ